MDLSGQISGFDGKVQMAKGFGTPDHNVIASAFAAGSTLGGPATTGGTLAYNNNGYGVALTKEIVPGIRDSLTQSAHANLYSNDTHSIDLNAFASQNKLANGFEFDRNGAGVGWSHVNGHSANAAISNIPSFGTQAQLGASANLWKSECGNTSLDAFGSTSQWMSGPFKGKTDYGAGMGLNYKF